MSEFRSFDVDRAYREIEALNYPRRIGTPGEVRAARHVRTTFSQAGLDVAIERFSVAFKARELANMLTFATGAALVALGWLGATSRPWSSVFCWALAGYLVNAPWRLTHLLERRRLNGRRSRNLLASLPEAAFESASRIVFMAHYDSKSQLLPTGLRVGFVIVARISCWFLAALGLFSLLSPGRIGLIGFLFPAGIAILAFLCLMVNLTGNRSPGALDNGSGLGTLLELARSWRPRPDAPAEVVWVATGAEEVGLDGARDFLARYQWWWLEKPTLLINLESLGSGHRVGLSGHTMAVRLAEDIAAPLGIPTARFGIVGAGMDHQPFATQGLPALSLLGDVIGRSLDLHSPRDRIGRIDRAALERAGRLASELAWAWAARQQADSANLEPARPLVES